MNTRLTVFIRYLRNSKYRLIFDALHTEKRISDSWQIERNMNYKLATLKQFGLGTTESTVVSKAKGKIADVISYSIQLDKKLKFISLCVDNQR